MTRLIANVGNERVIDELRKQLVPGTQLDICTPSVSIHAYAELMGELYQAASTRLALQIDAAEPAKLLGGPADRSARNRLGARSLARRCASWVGANVEVRAAGRSLPQAALLTRDPAGADAALIGSCAFTTDGLGVSPGDQFGLIQSASGAEAAPYLAWFESLWSSLPATSSAKIELIAQLERIAAHQAPWLLYNQVLLHLFRDLGEEFDEERIVKSATGIRETTVWRKLFRFQRDGVGLALSCRQGPPPWWPEAQSAAARHYRGRSERGP